MSHEQFAAQPANQAQLTAKTNALAESFVDTFKTELIQDRVWKTRSQMELAVIEWVHWFNHDRLHESLGDRPPVEVEAEYASRKNRMVDEDNCARTAPTAVIDETFGSGLSDTQRTSHQTQPETY